MSDRIVRHHAMAEKRINEHQAMTQAKIEGRTPVCPDRGSGRVVYFTPQRGEEVIEQGGSIFGKDGALKELQMYWQRIPDFGIKEYEIFPSETGWMQVLHWAGTTEDGREVRAQEADLYRTDADFNIVRVEYYCDARQWTDLAAYANGKDPESFGVSDYFASTDSH